MERCPNCRARWDGNTSCRRCGMDFGPLLAAERAAESLIARGIRHLAAAEPHAAKRDLTRANWLRRTRFSQALLAFVEAYEVGDALLPSAPRHSANPEGIWPSEPPRQDAGARNALRSQADDVVPSGTP